MASKTLQGTVLSKKMDKTITVVVPRRKKHPKYGKYINLSITKQDILWPGRPKWFAKSSGTSNNKSKYIPVTMESLRNCHFKAGKDMLSLYLKNNSKTKILNSFDSIKNSKKSYITI